MIAVGWTKAHDDVFGAADGFEPWLHQCGEIESGKGALTDDDGMHEFDGDVLGIGGTGSAAKWEKGTTAKEAVRTFTAGVGESTFFLGKEVFEDVVAQEQRFFDECCEIDGGRHRRLSTDARQ